MCNTTAPSSSVLACGEPREVDCDFVIPVYNEEAELGSSVMLLMEQLHQISLHANPFTWQIVIADNASSDKTWDLCQVLSAKFPFTVRALRIPQKGRGRALKLAWTESKARVRAYMDVDLSTDIRQIPELVGPVLDGRADLSFGSRLLPDSCVERCFKREMISRTYNRMLQSYLDVDFRDAQCGFKAISSEAAEVLLPKIEDDEWFFDTELLVLAERLGIATNEFAVRWREDTGSTVRIADTVKKDLAGMRRLKRSMGSKRLDVRAGGDNDNAGVLRDTPRSGSNGLNDTASNSAQVKPSKENPSAASADTDAFRRDRPSTGSPARYRYPVHTAVDAR